MEKISALGPPAETNIKKNAKWCFFYCGIFVLTQMTKYCGDYERLKFIWLETMIW